MRAVAVDAPARGRLRPPHRLADPGQHLRFSRQSCLEFLRATGAAELAGRVERMRPLTGAPAEGVPGRQTGPG